MSTPDSPKERPQETSPEDARDEHSTRSACCTARRPDETKSEDSSDPRETRSDGQTRPENASETADPAREGSGPPRVTAGSTEGMVRLPGGTFLMGTDSDVGFPQDGEGPVREVELDPFYVDRTAVTNRQFAAFVEDTGYETEAEEYGWSFVFHLFLDKKTRRMSRRAGPAPWWCGVDRAHWRWPEGPGSHIGDRMDHPVVHVSWRDARAYAEWAGKRLPTEAEWEYAARGGLEQKMYPWGDTFRPEGRHMCNIWQGSFPDENTEEDGFAGTCPVGSFPENGYGLLEVSGNVWEWCLDWFDPDHHVEVRENRDVEVRSNPTGPSEGEERVMRGGSYLCHDSYCNRYRVAARTSNTPDASTGNLGFRCVRDVEA